MALECDPPHLGDIGDDPQPFCEDPFHDDDCDCGARPDHAYEREMELRGERPPG